MVRVGKAQTPAQKRPQERKSAVQLNLGATETPSAIPASNSKAIAAIVAANSASAKLGTGFFVGKQGFLLTNFHVVQGTTTVGRKLSGTGTVISATKAVGYDLNNDLVLPRVDGVNAQPVTLGDSDNVYAGQPIVVIGNPEGLEQTVSNGLVGAIRSFNGRRLFQISAPISAGSSGSPVFNDHGEVIGVVVSSIEAGQNLNFAVPIDYAKPLLKGRTEQTISSLPKRNPYGARAGPAGHAGSARSSPTLEETLGWLVDKVGAAGYNHCSSNGQNTFCEKASYESVEARDCKLTFTSVFQLSSPRRGPAHPS